MTAISSVCPLSKQITAKYLTELTRLPFARLFMRYLVIAGSLIKTEMNSNVLGNFHCSDTLSLSVIVGCFILRTIQVQLT